MRITLVFGLSGPKKQVTWYQDIVSFPHTISFNNKKWSWVFYDKDSNGEYVLTLSEMASDDPRYNESMPSFEYMFSSYMDKSCQCGAIYTSFNWDHMKFCPLHKKWGDL